MVNHLHGETSREKNVQEWEKMSRGELAKHTDTKRDALMPFSRDTYKMRKQNCESVNLAKTFCIRHTHSLHESLTGLTFSFSLHYTQRPFSAVVSIQILIFAFHSVLHMMTILLFHILYVTVLICLNTTAHIYARWLQWYRTFYQLSV